MIFCTRDLGSPENDKSKLIWCSFALLSIYVIKVFIYDDAGKLLSMTEDEENYGLYTTTYEYDLIGNRTAIIKTNNETDKVAEYRKYVYNESSQVVGEKIYDGKKTEVPATVTTMEAINATGRLVAVKDGLTHVSVFLVNIATMSDWIDSRPIANTNPHEYTLYSK